MSNKFTIKQAQFHTGFQTVHMINYLIRTGIIEPSIETRKGRGNKRLFSFTDLVKLKMIKQILDQKISIKKLKDAIEKSKELKSLNANKRGVYAGENPIRFMVSDGKDIYFRKYPEEIIVLTMKGQMAFSFMLDISEIHNDLKKKIFPENNEKAA